MAGATEGEGRGQRSAASERELRERLAAVLAGTTPAQRLAWLEQAIDFAHRAGALPRTPAMPGT